MRCPTCGGETGLYGANLPYDAYAYRQSYLQHAYDQQRVANQLFSGGMQNNQQMHYPPPPVTCGKDGKDFQEVKPEPTPTAWSQFKALIRKSFP